MVQKQAGSSLEEVCFGALLEGFHNRPVTPKVAGKAGKWGGSLGGRVSESLTMFRTFWAIPEAARKEEAGLQRQVALHGNKSLHFSKVQFSLR